MSFILDALRKSETDRQQRGSAEFAGVPTSNRSREGPPAWLWIVGALLLINLAVLVGIFLRPDAEPPAANVAQAVETAPAAEPPRDEDFAEQVEAARRNAPRLDEAPPPATQRETRAPAAAAARAPTATLALPTIHEVRANGAVTLPELHVDIHVYSETPEDRFVFINMVKHNEGSRLPEGPLVSEITPDGVVLNQSGTVFLLPRD